MKFKEGIKLQGLREELTYIFPIIDKVHMDLAGREAIITSALDGKHGQHSFHYQGLALDLRTRDLTPYIAEKITEELQRELGNDYDVLLEHDHIHLEYDKK